MTEDRTHRQWKIDLVNGMLCAAVAKRLPAGKMLILYNEECPARSKLSRTLDQTAENSGLRSLAADIADRIPKVGKAFRVGLARDLDLFRFGIRGRGKLGSLVACQFQML